MDGFMPFIQKLAGLACALVLASCGGGSSSQSEGNPSSPPTSGTPGTPTTPSGPSTPAPPLANGHHRVGWIGAGDDAGAADFVANAQWFSTINPDWYELKSDHTLNPFYSADDPQVM